MPYLLRFQEEGWTVHVGCGGEAAVVPYADEQIDLPFKKSFRSPENFRASRILRRRIQEEEYTLICTHTSLAAFFTRLALQGMKERPVVVNMVHGYLFDDETPWMKRNILLAAERLTASVTELVLTMNQYDYDIARKYQLGKEVARIPGIGVDFSRFSGASAGLRSGIRQEYGIPDDAFVLICAAEFSARKSQSVLIRAMGQLPERVVLVLAGDGALLGECMAQAKRLGVADRVRFPGYIRDIGRWYDMADAAVSASRSEGLPFNIMEAMYAGLPVVASDVKGHSDLVTEGVTGLLYPYGDEQACAKQISQLLASEKLRRRLGGSGRENMEQYALENVFSVVWREYARLSAVDAYAMQRQKN